jgi:hypothetical protein
VCGPWQKKKERGSLGIALTINFGCIQLSFAQRVKESIKEIATKVME